MNGRHHLSARVKRSLADSGIRFYKVVLAHAERISVAYESRLGGFARDLAVLVNLRVAAQSHGCCYKLLVLAVMVGDGHLVLGKGTRFIRAYNLCAT